MKVSQVRALSKIEQGLTFTPQGYQVHEQELQLVSFFVMRECLVGEDRS